MTDVIREFSGYAYEWNTWGLRNADKRGVRNRKFCFLPGAFTFADGVNLTQDLNAGIVFASTTDGTLDLATDDTGLLVTARLIDNETNRLLAWKIDNHRVRGWSFYAYHPFGPWQTWRDGDFHYQEIVRARIDQVTLVVNKIPRMREGRTAPIFISGGPQPKEIAHV